MLGRWVVDSIDFCDDLVCTLWGVPSPSDKRFSDDLLSFFDDTEMAGSVVLLVLPVGGRTLTEGRIALELGGRGGRLISISWPTDQC